MYGAYLEFITKFYKREVEKYKSMYIKCCDKINRQKKIIRQLELKNKKKES